MYRNRITGFLFVSLILVLPLAAANISIPAVSATPGATVQIPINIDDATDVGGYQFTVTFDQTVLQATGVVAGSLTSGWMFTPNITVPGQVTVGGFDASL